MPLDPPVDLGDLRLFVAVAEELHFGRAAARLHLSQPGLSYRIRRMEERLGYELLTRSRRSVLLTAAGEELLEGARRLLGEARRVVDDGGRVARGERATLRVGFAGTALYSVLPALLQAARRRHPELRVTVREHKAVAALRALALGQLDLGLVHLPVAGEGIETMTLLEDPVGIALPDGHPLCDVRPLTLADLAGEPFVLFPRELEPSTYDRYVGACVAAGFAPRVAHEATGLQTILALVAAGAGIAFVAGSVAQSLTRAGVVFRALDGPAPRLVTGAAWSATASGGGVALLRALLAELATADRLGGSPGVEPLLDRVPVRT